MKDAKGHGSNGRYSMLDVNGRGIMPSRPFREGTAHQVSLAEDHGIETDHLVTGFTQANPGFKFGRDPASGQVTGFRRVK